MSDVVFKVAGESASPAKFIAKTRGFEMVVDEPENLGGTNEGANPVEYILAGLAGCINVVGHIVAKEMGFVIHNLKIEVEGNLNPNKLFALSNEDRAGFKQISLRLSPETEASEDILAKWLERVNERCPVKDNLMHVTPVRIELEQQYAIKT